ncbi:MAG: pyridoxal phosphate-dependent aminotransferase [Cytophagales bacterium]|jgi:aspartate aminotransferase|nr:pyridoxal phosphate-dependent aminotransferase [Cytophagales bacterium]MCE2895775.1 pyridoxal phosphate-dependent aminotransferase [Flammeovirgaceae bacterium]MCA6369633.1 pyridoxal phosphate-dependent aminotransferase [Cytophagales bacterium]MCA6372479.1 pyridoxal phosphate-dependent aminotransferase [Cytophagales bacterium]MCA6378030.1 pyridoxal phosphate-dependent aminotransferase [Cytophagales bacterium]
MNHLSNRINAIEESATLAMAAKAREYKNRGIDVINLSLGEPDFKTPQHICDAAKKAIDDGKYFSYPPVAGYQDLREAIAAKYQKENKVPYKAENIVVSNGAKQSIANVMLALLNPGDEVIVFAPYWVSYDALVRLTEATPVIINGTLENDFKVTAQQVEQAITKKTKAIIFSSPCNPTGSVFSKKELEAIAAVVLSHENLLIIADEIYEHINFTGDQTSMASLPGMFDRTITVNGFAKGFAMTGWRVGYIAAPKWIADGSNKVQGQITSANCSISQRGALAAITGDLAPTNMMVTEYHKRRDIVYKLLKEIPGVKANNPQGAFYFFPDVSFYFGKRDGDTVIKNADDFCFFMLDKGHVSLVPGGAFGDEKCVRLSYAASEKELVEAMSRMKKALASLT